MSRRAAKSLPKRARLDLSALVEARDESEHALMMLRETIDEHLPHYGPAHEDGDYISTVKQAGEELRRMIEVHKLDREAIARQVATNERLSRALEAVVALSDIAIKGLR